MRRKNIKIRRKNMFMRIHFDFVTQNFINLTSVWFEERKYDKMEENR
jgi:hypothetical protein